MIILFTDKEIQLKLVVQELMAREQWSWYLPIFPFGLKFIFMRGQNKVQPKSLYGKKLRNYEIFVVPYFWIISFFF